MSGRIRSIKPEWMEDEELLRAGVHARVLSVSLMLLADDHGNGRCIPQVMGAQVFPFEESSGVFRESLAKLSKMGFVTLYQVRRQTYFSIRNWKRHQRVDKPGKPHVPGPDTDESVVIEDVREFLGLDSRDSREDLAPDLRPTTYDLRPGGGAGGARAPAREEPAPPPPAPEASQAVDIDDATAVHRELQQHGWHGDLYVHRHELHRVAGHVREASSGGDWRALLARWVETWAQITDGRHVGLKPRHLLEDIPKIRASLEGNQVHQQRDRKRRRSELVDEMYRLDREIATAGSDSDRAKRLSRRRDEVVAEIEEVKRATA